MEEKLFSKNFTLLVLGQISSLFGNFILKFALSMYVLEITGSASVFAGILAVATIPTILLSPFGGILADRANRRNIMIALDTLTGISVLCAASLFSQDSGIAVIRGLLVMLSILGAFETPTVQACVPQILAGDNIIKGNAVVNQAAAATYMIAPILGSVLYVAVGIKLVMFSSIICFFITALFECFIKLDYRPSGSREDVISIIKSDFTTSMRFICKEQPCILKLLFLVSLVGFFVMGTAIIGLPYVIRTILKLPAQYYGAAESLLGIATIFGSITAGLLVGKLNLGRLSFILASLGAFIIPAGIAFWLPAGVFTRYAVNVAAFCGVQIASGIFSIFALSFIQQRTPNHLLGKVMSYISTITICVQPLGQALYGYLFDYFHDAVYIVLIPTGIIACAIGLSTTGFFKSLEKG